MIVPPADSNRDRKTQPFKIPTRRSWCVPGAALLCVLSLFAWPALSFSGSPFPTSELHAQTPANDSLYNASMNAGYAALRASNNEAAMAAFERALQYNAGSAAAHFQLGYIKLSLDQKTAAVASFEEGLARDESNDDVRRQLGYLYAALGRPGQALLVFQRLRDAGKAIPRDYVSIGNLSALAGDQSGAQTAYRAAIAASESAGDAVDATVVADARAGLNNLARSGIGGGLFAEVYFAPFYQDRFDNTVTLGFARVGIRGGGWWQPTLYASLRGTRDSRSTGGQQPVLFNDNTLIPAVGVRVRPGRGGLALYAEAGAAHALVDTGGNDWTRDLRAGVNYTGARELALRDNSTSPRLVSELSGDASFYERFDNNVIAYAQLRESLRFGRPDGVMLDVFARAWGATDSNGDFFNRVVEGGGGAAVHLPLGALRTSVYLDVLRGRYLSPPPPGSLLPRNYNDWRVTVSTGVFRFLPFEDR